MDHAVLAWTQTSPRYAATEHAITEHQVECVEIEVMWKYNCDFILRAFFTLRLHDNSMYYQEMTSPESSSMDIFHTSLVPIVSQSQVKVLKNHEIAYRDISAYHLTLNTPQDSTPLGGSGQNTVILCSKAMC